MLWLRHHTAFLGYQCVFLSPWQTIGSEELIVLLHTQRSPSQMTPGIIHWQCMSENTLLVIGQKLYYRLQLFCCSAVLICCSVVL